MSINKNFVVKNGLEVFGDLLVANSQTNRVGVGTTNPRDLLDIDGNITIRGSINDGSSTGIANQYLRATGSTVAWDSFPRLRSGFIEVASPGQTIFPAAQDYPHSPEFIDVYVDGSKLNSSEYSSIAADTRVQLVSALSGGETVELIAYNTVSVGTGGTGIQGISLRDTGVEVGNPGGTKIIDFVGAALTSSGTGVAVTVTIPSFPEFFWYEVIDEQTVYSDYNIGVGTSDIQSRLEVFGDSRISGNLLVAGISTAGSVEALSGIITSLSSTNINCGVLTATSIGSGIVTSVSISTNDLESLQINVSGVCTVGELSSTNANLSGILTASAINSTTGIITSLTTTDIITDTISVSGISSFSDLNVQSISVASTATIGTSLTVGGDLSVDGSTTILDIVQIDENGIGITTSQSSQALSVTGISTFDGITKFGSQIVEKTTGDFSTGIGTFPTIDLSSSTVVLGNTVGIITAWNFTNLSSINGTTSTVTVILSASSSNTYPSDYYIDGVGSLPTPSTVLWPSGVVPLPTNNYDIINFTVVRDGSGTYTIFGNSITGFA